MPNSVGEFFGFYREYAKSGVHAASAALLTAFGLLTSVHRAFLVVAVGAYIIPLLYFYATRERREASNEDERDTKTGEATGAMGETSRRWRATTPIDGTLHDVTSTAGGAVAVGERGIVLIRGSDGWETALENAGATGDTLRGVATSADGRAAWVAGDGGALGSYDTEESRYTDYSAPADITNTWEDIAVTGPVGAETVYLIDGSGQVLRGERNGRSVSWGAPTKPGSGSSMSAIEFTKTAGFCCDTNGTVFETTDGDEYAVVGIDDADALTDITLGTDAGTDTDTDAKETATVTAVDGIVHRYDGSVWTPRLVSDSSLTAITRRGDDTAAVDDTGTVFSRGEGEWNWKREPTPVDTPLRGIALLDDGVIAVGDDGCILEQQ